MKNFKKTKQKKDLNYYWIYGRHAVENALRNSKREIKLLIISENKKEKYLIHFNKILEGGRNNLNIEVVEINYFDKILGRCVHQGVAAQIRKLPILNLDDFLKVSATQNNIFSILIHKVTDPQNLGAIIRSAAAFNAQYVLISKNNSVKENQTVTKVSCGGIDRVQIFQIGNLSSALKKIKKNNWIIIGLDALGKINIYNLANYIQNENKIIFVVGSEEKGISSIIRKNCDYTFSIPINLTKMESLNVASAAAISLYEISKAFSNKTKIL